MLMLSNASIILVENCLAHYHSLKLTKLIVHQATLQPQIYSNNLTQNTSPVGYTIDFPYGECAISTTALFVVEACANEIVFILHGIF